jgi:Mn2+/Fe2+ NRAMP family transporter
MSPPEGETQPNASGVQQPPTTLFRILSCVGPGLIVAGSIVGSGELIATTKTGAEVGFTLLWLIVLGCVVKVFAQIELGRYTLSSGKTTLQALDEVPGPRVRGRGNWLVWYWLLMWVASISQQGGIVGGVGQALSISSPLTAQGQLANELADQEQLLKFDEFARSAGTADAADPPEIIEVRRQDVQRLRAEYQDKYGNSAPNDVKIWAGIMAVATSLVLVWGRYGLIQGFSTVLVASFTLLTIVNVFLLQGEASYRVSWSEIMSGLSFSLPGVAAEGSSARPIATALATFGIIGVGAAELVVYPYWCLEKGYAKYTGRNDGSDAWKQRAVGWMRVMRVDAWGAMVVYTFATIAFYLMGAAVLYRIGLNPEKSDMVRTLAVMFVPVFSDWAATVFLFGAIAVLYSTFFVANASHARVFSDALRVMGVIDSSEQTRQKWIRGLSGVFPLICWLIFIAFQSPAKLVLLSGVAQGIMLPMLAAAALYFRYYRIEDALRPGRLWDAMLWLSAAAMLVTGIWTIVSQF